MRKKLILNPDLPESPSEGMVVSGVRSTMTFYEGLWVDGEGVDTGAYGWPNPDDCPPGGEDVFTVTMPLFVVEDSR